jgi:kynurenine formamidase
MIDSGGPLEKGMWSYGDPYPPVEVRELPPAAWVDYITYSQAISLGVQSSTYLETASHLYEGRITIDRLPLERCFLDAVVLKIPLEADEHITSELVWEETIPSITSPGSSNTRSCSWPR